LGLAANGGAAWGVAAGDRPPGAANPGPAPHDFDSDAIIMAATADFADRAEALAATLMRLGALQFRGQLSLPIGHPIQWLRTLVKAEYEPVVLESLARMGGAGRPGAGAGLGKGLARLNLSWPARVNLPASRHTIARFIGATFDVMSTLAADWLSPYDAWPELGAQPAHRFWNSPVTKAARAFIDAAFPVLVFEDFDASWAAYAADSHP
jgi:hypothetical protein